MSQKQIRRKFGVTRRPLEATRVYGREMGFDHKDVDTRTLLVINEDDRTYIHVNLYNGNMGRNFDPASTMQPLPDLDSEDGQKWLTKKTKKLQQIEPSEWPDVIVGVGESQAVTEAESDAATSESGDGEEE